MSFTASMPGAPHTASAASSVHRPANTDKAAVQPLLVLGEQVVAPVERRPQRALALGEIGGASTERVERPAELVEQRSGREQPQPGRGQLERQGEPVEPPDDGRHVAGVLWGDPELGPYGPGPLLEETHGGARGHGRQVVGAFGRQVERLDPVLLLATDAKRHPARDEGVDAGAASQQIRHVGSGGDDLLQVVQYQEHVLVGERFGQALDG
jgi:hypothetical protein